MFQSYKFLDGEIEIDLIQLIKDLLMQWKAILCVMIIFGLLLPAGMLAKDTHDYNKSLEDSRLLQEKLAEATKNGKVDSAKLYDQLTDAEKVSLDSAILKQDSLDTRKDYAENSLYMNIDPSKARRLYVQYTVSGSVSYLSTIVDMYLSATEDGEFITNIGDAFKNYLTSETKNRYVRELISTSNGGGPTGLSETGTTRFSVIILMPNDAVESSVVTQAVRDYMEKKEAFITDTVGKHQLSFVKYEDQVKEDQDMLSVQTDTKLGVQTAQGEINTLVDAMTDLQKQIFIARTGVILTNVDNYNLDTNGDEIMDAMDINLNGINDAEEEYNFDKDGDGENDDWDLNENGVIDSIESVPFAPDFSLKYAIIGLLVGMVLYGGIYLMKMIMVPLIRTGDELSGMAGIKSFGVLHPEPEKYGLMNDKLVYRILYGKNSNFDSELSDVAERIGVYAKYNQLASLTVLCADKKSGARVKKLCNLISAKGVGTDVLELYENGQMTSVCETKMIDKDNYLLCLIPGETKIIDLDSVLAVCKEYNKRMVGTVSM